MQARAETLNARAELLEAVCARDTAQAELDAAALRVSRAAYDFRIGGGTVRDIAGTLGITTQRTYQLLARAESELRAEYEADEWKASYVRGAVRAAGKKSGWKGGRVQPRCSGCDHFIATPTSRCRRCGDWGGET